MLSTCRKFAISARNLEWRRQAKKRRNRGGTWLVQFLIGASRTFETDSDIHDHTCACCPFCQSSFAFAVFAHPSGRDSCSTHQLFPCDSAMCSQIHTCYGCFWAILSSKVIEVWPKMAWQSWLVNREGTFGMYEMLKSDPELSLAFAPPHLEGIISFCEKSYKPVEEMFGSNFQSRKQSTIKPSSAPPDTDTGPIFPNPLIPRHLPIPTVKP